MTVGSGQFYPISDAAKTWIELIAHQWTSAVARLWSSYHYIIYSSNVTKQSAVNLGRGIGRGKLSFEKRITSLPWFLCASILSLHPTSKILFASAPYRQYPALKTYIQLAQASQHCLFKVVSRLIHVDPDKYQQLARSDEIWWARMGYLEWDTDKTWSSDEFWKSC